MRKPVAILLAGLVLGTLLVGLVSSPAFADVRTWTGGGATQNWSDDANWQGNIEPVSGDSVVFPAGPSQKNVNVDVAGLVLDTITVQAADYALFGQEVELSNFTTTHASGFVNQALNVAVPNNGTLTYTIGAGGQVQSNIGYDIGANGTLDWDVDGELTTNFSMANSSASAEVIARGTGTIKLTQGITNPPTLLTHESGTLLLDYQNFNQSGILLHQTGGTLFQTGMFVDSLTLDGGTWNVGKPNQPVGNAGVSALVINPGGTFQVDMSGDQEQTNLDSPFVQDNGNTVAVEGTVDVTGGTLEILAGSFVPTEGNDFVILRNDNADPVVGTFAGLPDGGTLAVNGFDLTIDYQGGDGNDIALEAPPAVVWDGGGANSNWTTANNWNPNTAPVGNADETLLFPSSPISATSDNNFSAGTVFKNIVFDGVNYDLTGNRVNLSGGISVNTSSGFPLAISFPLELSDGGFIQFANTGSITFNGQVSVDGGGLAIGNGSVTINGADKLVNDLDGTETTGTLTTSGNLFVTGNQPNFAGPITINNGFFQPDGVFADAAAVIHGGFMGGGGGVDGITADGGNVQPGGQGTAADFDSTGNVTLGAGSTFNVDLNGPTVATEYDQLDVAGTVTLGATLTGQSTGTPPVGSNLVIINNDGSDAVSGTFVGQPEGSTFTVNGVPFTISYQGGTGNDVVLSVPNSKIWDGGGGNASWATGANWNNDTAPNGNTGETLIFPEGANQLTSSNNLGSSSFDDLLFTGATGGYTLNGSGATLAGNLVASNTGGVNTVNLPLTFTGGGSITVPSGGSLVVGGATTIGNGNTLAVNGAGVVDFNGDLVDGALTVSGGGTVSIGTSGGLDGPITVSAGSLVLESTNTAAAVTMSGTSGLLGAGTVGGITMTGGGLNPGVAAKGVITSDGNVSMSGSPSTTFDVDGTNPGTTHDQLVVNGTVAVAGFFSVGSSATPPVGSTVTLIVNDGSDAVSGTFTGLPEGGTFQVNGFDAVISYVGGTGNDVTVTFPPTFTWDGGGGDANWMTAANWSNNVAPSGNAGETLVFPDSVPQTTNANNFPVDTSFDSIRVNGSAYTISGNRLALDGGIQVNNGFANVTTSFPIVLTGGGSLEAAGSSTLNTQGTVDADGGALTLLGAGTHNLTGEITNGAIVKSGTGTTTITPNLPSLAGPITLDNGVLEILGDTGSAGVVVNGGQLQGDADFESLTVTSGDVAPGAATPANFSIDAGLELQGPGSDYEVDLDTQTPGSGHDQLDVTGTVAVGGDLEVTLISPPAAGARYVIIENDLADAVTGTFTGLAAGDTFDVNGTELRIIYNGGDGNDVVLEFAPYSNAGGGGGGDAPASTPDCSSVLDPEQFADIDPTSVHAAAVACLAALGITTGTGDGNFDPLGTVGRAQDAAMIVRLLLVVGETVPSNPPDAFGDDDGILLEAEINKLAALGIINGKSPGIFDPSAPVTRGQVATILRNVLQLILGAPIPAGPDAFDDDDGDIHEDDINALAALGVITGTGPDTFNPNGELRREQLASLLSRLLALV